LKKIISSFLAQNGCLLLILVIGAGLRFYRLPEMASFDFDQEYASNFAYSVLRQFPIQMMGQGLSVQGLFMGPWYFYFLVPFYAVYGLHPLGGAVGSVILGLITIIAFYYFGSKLFGRPAGLIAAFFQAVLFRNLVNDWSITPAFSCGLAVIITWYYLYKYWQGETKQLPLLGFIFGLFTSFHPILFPFYLVFLTLFIYKRIFPSFKIFLLTIVAFISPLVPLIAFEYFHRFTEVKLLLEIFTSAKMISGGSSIFSKLADFSLIILGDPQYILGLKFFPGYLLSTIILSILLLFTVKKIHVWKENFHLWAIITTFLIFIFYYSFFPIPVISYYLSAPVTLLVFYLAGILGYLTTNKFLRIFVIIFLFFLAFINIKTLIFERWFNPSLITLSHKDEIVKVIREKQPKEKDFFVSYISSPGWNFGFNYFFKIYGIIPKDKAVNDYIYTIVIPKELSPDSINFSSGNIGLILPKSMQ